MPPVPQPEVRKQKPRPIAKPRLATPTWEEAVEDFLEAKKGKNLTPATLENYRWHLMGPRARQFVEDERIETPGDVTAEALARFQAELVDRKVSDSLAHAFHRVFRNFLNFCDSRGYGPERGAFRVEAPKIAQTEPEVFTPSEEKQLLLAARSPRDRFLIEFLLRTGVRVTELCGITLDDLERVLPDSPGPFDCVKVTGKGRKDRRIPLDSGGSEFSKSIQTYIRQIRPEKAASNYLFLSARRRGRGRSAEYGALTPRAVQVLLNRLGKATGIHVHPHKFRHTFATRSLAAGVSPLVLQRVLGHTTLAMVNRYIHFRADDLIQAWRARPD
jgi:site-specific recombinase XerD